MVEARKGYPKGLVELVSVGAVLMGLIFVGFELKQNAEAVEAATLQGITDASQDYLLLMAADPGLSAVPVKSLDPRRSKISSLSALYPITVLRYLLHAAAV